eukprot:579861-Pyramimonas_sp.AAC.1
MRSILICVFLAHIRALRAVHPELEALRKCESGLDSYHLIRSEKRPLSKQIVIRISSPSTRTSDSVPRQASKATQRIGAQRQQTFGLEAALQNAARHCRDAARRLDEATPNELGGHHANTVRDPIVYMHAARAHERLGDVFVEGRLFAK